VQAPGKTIRTKRFWW